MDFGGGGFASAAFGRHGPGCWWRRRRRCGWRRRRRCCRRRRHGWFRRDGRFRRNGRFQCGWTKQRRNKRDGIGRNWTRWHRAFGRRYGRRNRQQDRGTDLQQQHRCRQLHRLWRFRRNRARNGWRHKQPAEHHERNRHAERLKHHTRRTAFGGNLQHDGHRDWKRHGAITTDQPREDGTGSSMLRPARLRARLWRRIQVRHFRSSGSCRAEACARPSGRPL